MLAGGYHQANTARCWTRITAGVVGAQLGADIPEHDVSSRYSFVRSVYLTHACTETGRGARLYTCNLRCIIMYMLYESGVMLSSLHYLSRKYNTAFFA